MQIREDRAARSRAAVPGYLGLALGFTADIRGDPRTMPEVVAAFRMPGSDEEDSFFLSNPFSRRPSRSASRFCRSCSAALSIGPLAPYRDCWAPFPGATEPTFSGATL